MKSWIEFIPEIIAAIHSHNEAQYDEWRSEKVKSLDDFGGNEIADLCNLKKETIRRFGDGQDYMFDWYIDVLRFCPCDPRNVPLLEKNKNAIRRSLTFLQNELQTMSTSGFKNTGIVNDPRCETDLFSELYSPYISGAHAFLGCNYNLGKLHYLEGHGDFGDRWLARSLLDEIKEVINRYVYFTNEEPDDETVILVRLAIYLDALECKCILNKSNPNDLQFRIKLLSESEYEELLRPDEESMEELNLDLLDALVKLVDGE